MAGVDQQGCTDPILLAEGETIHDLPGLREGVAPDMLDRRADDEEDFIRLLLVGFHPVVGARPVV